MVSARSGQEGMRSERLDVKSPDGTQIAAFITGEGPPLVLVHGAMSDHRNDDLFIAELARNFTAVALDRRGRGASTDHDDYSIEREFEDIAAVVDTVADRMRERVVIWGHSYGADCAMGVAPLTPHVSRQVFYEPGLGMAYPEGSVDAVEAALAADDEEAAAVAVMSKVVGMTDEEVEFVRSLPTWPERVELVRTVPRELTAESSWVYRPGWLDRVTVPTLLLAGGDSPAAQTKATHRAAAAIPDSRILVLDGHGHIAHRTDPAMVAEIVARFISTGLTDRL